MGGEAYWTTVKTLQPPDMHHQTPSQRSRYPTELQVAGLAASVETMNLTSMNPQEGPNKEREFIKMEVATRRVYKPPTSSTKVHLLRPRMPYKLSAFDRAPAITSRHFSTVRNAILRRKQRRHPQSLLGRLLQALGGLPPRHAETGSLWVAGDGRVFDIFAQGRSLFRPGWSPLGGA